MTYGADLIYLDHAATTPTDPAVVQAMLPYFSAKFGNPSSIYRVGQLARTGLDHARLVSASVLGSRTSEILFTSGATESNNLALKGIAWAARLANPTDAKPPHIITTAFEHHAVLHAAQALEAQGFAVTYLPCDTRGLVDPADVAAAIRPETCLISVMYANNEVGAIQPIAAIGAIARQAGIPMHTDAVQAAGTLPLNVHTLDVDLLSLSAHKFYGPKGVGLLYVRKGTPIRYQQDGGGQESGRRGGTENVPLIVGLGQALTRATASLDAYNQHASALRDLLWARIQQDIPDVRLNGPEPGVERLANNLNISIRGIQGETVLLALDMEGVEASAGSACTTGNSEPSHVLLAMGLSEAETRSSLRLTVGRGNTVDEIKDAVDALREVVMRVRSLSGVE
ncbi:MAG: cysteine desulfurase family protein [Thermomicrobiales bacterium]